MLKLLMPTYGTIDGVQRELTAIPAVVGGVQRDLDFLFGTVDGTEREIFSSVKYTWEKYSCVDAFVEVGEEKEISFFTLGVTVEGEYAAVKAAFNGQGWSVADGEGEYDKSNYTLVASICDNMDGTITVRVGRKNTAEETLQDEKNALAAEKAALAAEIAEQAEVISILAGGAV